MFGMSPGRNAEPADLALRVHSAISFEGSQYFIQDKYALVSDKAVKISLLAN